MVELVFYLLFVSPNFHTTPPYKFIYNSVMYIECPRAFATWAFSLEFATAQG